MLITVSSLKGGVGKTSIAVHLAAYLQTKAPTMLIDYDPNRSALNWSERGDLPFIVAGEQSSRRYISQVKHTIADTEASLEAADLKDMAGGCELIIIPASPDGMSIEATLMMVKALDSIGAKHYKALLSIIPPLPSRAGDEARETLNKLGIPLFQGGIRRFVAHQKAALAGCLVNEVSDPHAQDAWNDYVSIGREIIK